MTQRVFEATAGISEYAILPRVLSVTELGDTYRVGLSYPSIYRSVQ